VRQGGFATKAAALRWERETRAAYEQGTYRDPEAGAVTFAEWAKTWLRTRATLKESSQAEESSIVKHHLVPAFGKLRLDAVGPLAVETLISDLTKRKAPKTVRNIHGVLHNVMALAVREGLIPSNPCVGTRLPEGERRKVMACLTEQQLGHLFAQAPEYWRPLIVFLAGTGFRWGEAVGLKVKYLDLFSREVTVRETLNPTATRWGTPKTKAGRRTIGLPGEVVDVLIPLVAGKSGDDPVFTMPDGSLIKHRWFNYTIWQPLCVKVGIVATPHDLRHTHAALLIAAGVPLSAIKVRLGHESIHTTDGTYGYLLPRVEDALLKGLDRALSGSRETSSEPSEISGEPSVIPEQSGY
jgi:integrase